MTLLHNYIDVMVLQTSFGGDMIKTGVADNNRHANHTCPSCNGRALMDMHPTLNLDTT